MRFTNPKLSTKQIALILLAALPVLVLLKPEKIHAQRNPPPTMALVGPAAPLPVYVVNDPPPVLPEGFTPGTSWKFTSWTIPNNLSFTATVQKTEGAWAFMTLSTDTTSRWYYIPYMPGAWEPQ